MEALDLRHIESFIHFHLNQREGKDGRRRRGTKITRSLRTFWDEFRLLYRREILADIDWKADRNAVNNVRPAFAVTLLSLTMAASCEMLRRLQAVRREEGKPPNDPRQP